MIKKIGLLLALILFSCTVVSCTAQTGKRVDPTKTQLYVGFFEGGWGREWLDLMIEDFEAEYPQYQVFAEGKKNEFTGDTLRSSINSNIYDMYFTTIIPHDMVANESENNKLMDITDIVTQPLTEWGETSSIADKMDPFMKDYVKSTNANGNYYTIPLYTSFYNVIYDVDLFEEVGLYFAEDGSFTKGKDGDKEKSVGQDGIKNTLDDGLPITWEDYKTMLNKMKMANIMPFIWAGDTPGYRTDMLTSMWASHQGPDSFNLNFSLKGIDASLNNLEINTQNAFELQKQPGKKYALEFAEYIVKNKFYDDRSFKPSLDYLSAQDEYLYSKYKADEGEKRIAMLIDGGWWENEAKNTIEIMANDFKGEYINRRFGIMTFPRFDETASSIKTLYSVTGNSSVFIRKNATQPDLAKKFLQFTTTDKNLRLYNRVTGSTRSYDYQLLEEDLQAMSHFKRSLWDVFSDKKNKVVYSLGTSDIVLKNHTYFRSSWLWSATLSDGNNISEPFSAFEQKKNLDAATYFDSLYNYHKNRWSQIAK